MTPPTDEARAAELTAVRRAAADFADELLNSRPDIRCAMILTPDGFELAAVNRAGTAPVGADFASRAAVLCVLTSSAAKLCDMGSPRLTLTDMEHMAWMSAAHLGSATGACLVLLADAGVRLDDFGELLTRFSDEGLEYSLPEPATADRAAAAPTPPGTLPQRPRPRTPLTGAGV